jgi:hypothetical protein
VTITSVWALGTEQGKAVERLAVEIIKREGDAESCKGKLSSCVAGQEIWCSSVGRTDGQSHRSVLRRSERSKGNTHPRCNSALRRCVFPRKTAANGPLITSQRGSSCSWKRRSVFRHNHNVHLQPSASFSHSLTQKLTMDLQ